jgi:Acyl-CoA dehydrogenases
MDFAISPELELARQKVRTLVHDEIIPLESDPANYDSHGNINHDALGRMRARAKQEQLWSPQMPKERGGLGWGPVGMSVLYEEMNHSIFWAREL